MLALTFPAAAQSVFVDLNGGSATPNVGTDTYNVIANPEGTTTTNHPLASGGNLTLEDLQDSDGVPTTIDVTVSTYNDGPGQLRGGQGTGGTLSHNPVAGIEDSASGDSFWINNHNSNGAGAGNEFGFVLTFDDLTEPLYNITVLAVTNNAPGSWAVTTGTGDSDVIAFDSDQDNVLTWTNVTPVNGTIILTGTTVPLNGTFLNTSVSFASIESIATGGISDPQIFVPASVDFEIVPTPPGVATKTIAIRNIGATNNLDISSTVFTGPNAANFSVTSAPATLTPGEIGEIEIAFDALTNTGILTASLELTSNDPDDSPVIIGLTATVDPDGDSDDDGSLDSEEETDGTDPLNPDSDGDTLLDGEEATLGTNPLSADSDGDGFSDPDEVNVFSSDPNDPDADLDMDNLTDAEEFTAGTNPGVADTDGDELNDGAELASNPASDPLSSDTDSDGLNDKEEADANTDPTNPDSDGDGISDGSDSNPTDANAPIAGGLATVFSTGFEYSGGAPIAGTDVTNLDGADDQIGSWSGTVPAADTGDGGTELFSFQDVAGDQFLLADRPGDIAAFDAILANPVTLELGKVSFDLGVRRTVGSQNKDLEIVGLDSFGEESFHLVISANSNGTTRGRIGVQTIDGGGVPLFDLPTVVGEDSPGDLPFFSGTQLNDFGNVSITLEADGYVLTFSKDSVVYVTEKLAFNGTPLNLDSIRFIVSGSPDDGNSRGGLWLNDIEVRGITTTRPTQSLEIISIDFDEAQRNTTIRFGSTPDAFYTAEYSDNLIDWFLIADDLESGGTETEFIESGISTAAVKRFYRFTQNPEMP